MEHFQCFYGAFYISNLANTGRGFTQHDYIVGMIKNRVGLFDIFNHIDVILSLLT